MGTSIDGQQTTTEDEAQSDNERAEGTKLERKMVGVVKAEHVELRAAVAGLVFAEDEVVLERAGARDVVTGGDLHITQGGAGAILTGGDTSIRQGGAGTVISLGKIDLEQSGAGTLFARDATIGRGGVVVLAITPRLAVAAGGRVFGGPTAVLTAVVGLTLGFAAGRVLRRRSA
jgi:hypothetical protein